MRRLNPRERLSIYEKRVAKLATEESNELIPNGDAMHAKIIVQNLFLRGQQIIRIFTSSFKNDIYDDSNVIDALVRFLNKPHTRVKVLLQDPENDLESKRIYTVCKGRNNCEIRYINNDSKDKDLGAHFITMDDKAYRFCPDINDLKAVASFNRKDTVDNLNGIFDELFSKYSEYQ